MNKFSKKFLSFFAAIACKFWWPCWSNLRWHKVIRKNIGLAEGDKPITSISEAKRVVSKIYNVFEYTKDGFDDLGDSIVPPPQNYQNYIDKNLKDDCDGFHATVMHYMYNSNIESYLLSVIALGCSHCILVFNFEGLWYINDYTTIYKGYETIQEAIKAYNEGFGKIYTKAKSEVYYNNLIKYDYEKGKFKNQPFNKIKD